jgi:PmbA protein
LEEILQKAARAAQHAEVYRVKSRVTPVRFESNRLKQVSTKESMGTALRLIKDGRIGFASASGNVKADELVNMALDTSKFGAEAKFDFPGKAKYGAVKTYDSRTEKMPIDSLVETGQKLIDAVVKHSPDIVCEGHISRGVISIEIMNSNGGKAAYTKSYFSAGVEGVVVKDGEMLFVGDGDSSCHPVTDIKPMADEIILQLEMAKDKANIRTAVMPVIFHPYGVASALVSPLMSAFNGKVVYNGASPLKDKIGVEMFDPAISLWDDATIDYQTGSGPCDDEGVPAGKNALIEKGKVASFIYDLQTAGLAGKKSTGNGGRGGGSPSPSPNSLVFSEGKTSYADLLADIKEGLLIYQLMGATQGNILNGDFSGNVLLGYKIENGKVVGRVKDTMASGNVYQLLKKVILGNDSRWVEGFLKTPSIYCPGMSVAAKGV